jgi:hypothetical protein
MDPTAGDEGLALARQIIRRRQRNEAVDIPTGSSVDARSVALARVADYERSAHEDGPYLRVGPFRYDRDIERRRWAWTREVIDRCDLGPLEDGNYFSLLARQAASVEMLLTNPEANPSMSLAARRIVFGTTGKPSSHASAVPALDAVAILVSAGKIYFVYQSAKSVVQAFFPKEPPEGGLTSFSSRLEDVAKVLDRDRTAADLLARLMYSWFYHGVARPPDSTAPPLLYQPALGLLIACAERFILAHEYSHALLDLMRVVGAEDPPLTGHAKELRADVWGMHLVLDSAAEFDGFAPNLSLQGVLLALKAEELLDRALEWAGLIRASTTHPSFERRRNVLLSAYNALPQVQVDPKLSSEPSVVPAEALEMIWSRVADDVKHWLASGRPLHPLWNQYRVVSEEKHV